MAEVKKQYTIEFTYTDNGQIFQSGAQLTVEETKKMERVLEQYEKAGAITDFSVFEPKSVEQDYDKALDEIMQALVHEVPDGHDTSECQNCGSIWPDPVLINPIPDLQQRVAAGGPMPSGECPSCGALCHSS